MIARTESRGISDGRADETRDRRANEETGDGGRSGSGGRHGTRYTYTDNRDKAQGVKAETSDAPGTDLKSTGDLRPERHTQR